MQISENDIEFAGQALKLEPGGLYVLECEVAMTQEGVARMREALDSLTHKYGVKFILLENGLRVARHREAVEPVQS